MDGFIFYQYKKYQNANIKCYKTKKAQIHCAFLTMIQTLRIKVRNFLLLRQFDQSNQYQ